MHVVLTRISHRLSAAARDKAVSASLRLVTVLDVLSKYAPRADLRAPGPEGAPHGILTRLATKLDEKCGLKTSIYA